MTYKPMGPIESKLNTLLNELIEDQVGKAVIEQILILQNAQTLRIMRRAYGMGWQDGVSAIRAHDNEIANGTISTSKEEQ